MSGVCEKHQVYVQPGEVCPWCDPEKWVDSMDWDPLGTVLHAFLVPGAGGVVEVREWSGYHECDDRCVAARELFERQNARGEP